MLHFHLNRQFQTDWKWKTNIFHEEHFPIDKKGIFHSQIEPTVITLNGKTSS